MSLGCAGSCTGAVWAVASLSPAVTVALPALFPSNRAEVTLGELLLTFPAACPQLPPSDTVTFQSLERLSDFVEKKKRKKEKRQPPEMKCFGFFCL